MRPTLKRELRQRLMNFEAFNGAFVFIPWGVGFIYCGLYAQAFGYTYAMVSAGLVVTIWGLRKVTVNRIKQQAEIDLMVEEEKIERRIR